MGGQYDSVEEIRDKIEDKTFFTGVTEDDLRIVAKINPK